MTIEPTPPVKQPRILRVSVLLLCAAALLLVAAVGWRIVAQQRDLAAAHRDATERTHQIDALIQQIRHDQADAARDRATGNTNVRSLLGYTKALAAQQAAENAWLRAHHIPIPARLTAVVPAPRIVVLHRHHHAHRSGTRHHRSSSSSTTPPAPGKSGGHRRHPKRHRH